MSIQRKRVGWILLVLFVQVVLTGNLLASTSADAKRAFTQLLLGKDVKSLIEMPAYKDGIDIFFAAPSGKHRRPWPRFERNDEMAEGKRCRRGP